MLSARQFTNLVERCKALDLKHLAEVSRQGHHTATVHYPSPKPNNLDDFMFGGYHIHIRVDFEDGVKWLARIRHAALAGVEGNHGKIVTESEVTTQRLVRAMGAKVPNVWALRGASLAGASK